MKTVKRACNHDQRLQSSAHPPCICRHLAMFPSAFRSLLAVCVVAVAATAAPSSSDCTGTISSLDDVASAVKCTTVNVNAFTVPAGQTFNLALLAGTTVNMRAYHSHTSPRPCPTITYCHLRPEGDVTFGNKTWAGPLFQVR